MRQAFKCRMNASESSGAASLVFSHFSSASIASFHVFVELTVGHFNIWSVVSFWWWHPGHSADVVCFLLYKEAFVPQNPLFHFTTSFFQLGCRSEKAQPKLSQSIVSVLVGMFFLIFQYCRDFSVVIIVYRVLSRQE